MLASYENIIFMKEILKSISSASSGDDSNSSVKSPSTDIPNSWAGHGMLLEPINRWNVPCRLALLSMT